MDHQSDTQPKLNIKNNERSYHNMNIDIQYEDTYFNSVAAERNKFTLLHEGYYAFNVLSVEIVDVGSSNPCPTAKIRLKIKNEAGNVVINHNIFLNSYSVKEVIDFFESIGKPLTIGEKPDWDEAVGESGGCYLIQKELTFKTINKVKRFVPAENHKY